MLTLIPLPRPVDMEVRADCGATLDRLVQISLKKGMCLVWTDTFNDLCVLYDPDHPHYLSGEDKGLRRNIFVKKTDLIKAPVSVSPAQPKLMLEEIHARIHGEDSKTVWLQIYEKVTLVATRDHEGLVETGCGHKAWVPIQLLEECACVNDPFPCAV